MSVPITPGVGANIATELVGGNEIQLFKRTSGGTGVSAQFLDKLSGSDTFTTTGNGTTRDCSAQGMSKFSLQVTKTGAVTSWSVDLQISLDGTNWTTLITHTNVDPGDTFIVSSGANRFPALYFRTKCTAIALGGGTNVVAIVLGLP